MSTQWLPLLSQCLQRHAQAVRVVVAAVRGSAPRDPGACMLVTADTVHGTVGGGRLEWEVLDSARALLGAVGSPVRVRKFVLGSELAQCCGGVVEVWFERHGRDALEWLVPAGERSRCEALELHTTLLADQQLQHSVERRCGNDAARTRLQIGANGALTLIEALEQPVSLYLYGAGHVGRAVLRIAAELPWQLTCIDSRAQWLNAAQQPGVTLLCTPEPVASVAQAPAGSCFLVMTHSHALDYALVHAALGHATAWVGLIGSHSKSARFRAQLRRDGVAATAVERLVCPIGIALHDKHPTAIAVSVVAQLLQHLQTAPTQSAIVLDAACTQSCSQCTQSVAPL